MRRQIDPSVLVTQWKPRKNNKRFKPWIRRFMKVHDIKICDLNKYGVSPSTFHYWTKSWNPHDKTLIKLSNALSRITGLDYLYIFSELEDIKR
jgi:hypothetical protein